MRLHSFIFNYKDNPLTMKKGSGSKLQNILNKFAAHS